MKFVNATIVFAFLIICSVFGAEQEDLYGYGRITVTAPVFILKEDGCLHDKSDFFRKLSILAEFKRQNVLRNEEKGAGGKNLNIAAFAFEFFDSDENSIFADPVFYGHPCDKYEDITEFKTPHFFLSGRHRHHDLGDHISSLGPSPTNLSVAFINFDGHICTLGNEYNKLYKTIEENSPVSVSNLTPMVEALKQVFYADCERIFNVLPFEKAWFTNIVGRLKTMGRKPTAIDKICSCEKHEKLSALKSYGKRVVKDEGIITDADIFTHSEQVGLGCMFNEETISFRRFLLNLRKTHPEAFEGEKVKHVVLDLYTYNTICARCAWSVQIDFRKKKGILDILKEFFGQNIQLRIVIGAKKQYDETIHRDIEIPTSSFQDHIYREEYPIPFYDQALATNSFIYQWIMDEKHSFQQKEEEEADLTSSSKVSIYARKRAEDFRIVPITPDGDCMYASILEGIKGSQLDSSTSRDLLTLRRQVSSEIEERWGVYFDLLVIQLFENIRDGDLVGFQGDLLQEMQDLHAQREQIKKENDDIAMADVTINDFIATQGIIEQYREMIKANAAWGGNVELGILSRIVGAQIIVQRRNQEQPDPAINNTGNPQAETVYLDYNGTHYNLMVLN